jgi:hypothetical protein
LQSAPKAEVVQLPTRDFVQCEKNLAEIGFFSPTNKKIKNVKAKIMTGFVNTGDGKRIMRKVSIIPAALYGLPTTAHRPNFRASGEEIPSFRARDSVPQGEEIPHLNTSLSVPQHESFRTSTRVFPYLNTSLSVPQHESFLKK